MKKTKKREENTVRYKEPHKLRLVWQFLSGSKRFFVLCVICTLLISLLELINPKIIGFTIDSVIGVQPAQDGIVLQFVNAIGGVDHLRSNVWIVAVMILVIGLMAATFRYLFRLFNSIAAETLVLTMRKKLFAHIERLPFEWHSKNQTGDIIQRCTSDVDTVKRFLSEQLTSIFRIAALIVLSLVFMYRMNPVLATIALVTIPIIVTYSAIFHKKISKNFAACDEAEGTLSAVAQENLTGVRVVRAFGREKFERERFHKASGTLANLWMRLNRLFSLFWSVGDFISGIQVMLIITVGTVICVNYGMTAGDFIVFISYNSMLIWPVRQLGRVISQMSQAGIALDRIAYIMNSPEEKDIATTLDADMKGDIVFDNVSFEYGNGVDVLQNVSFEIKSGTTFGILGGTGSGKSTLMYLLDRLYDLPAENGRITIGGVDIADMKAEEVRRNIGMVMQEPFLFSRTIEENIKIADENCTEQSMRESSDIACLTETVDAFTEGFDTMVGERGVTLSGGQKQRTAIARMLTRNTPIMVFDDSLSAVDAETDAKIRQALNNKTGNSTVILISHRTSTLMHADKILVLDHGKVSDIGTHEELISRDGIYKKIYDIQMQSKEVDE